MFKPSSVLMAALACTTGPLTGCAPELEVQPGTYEILHTTHRRAPPGQCQTSHLALDLDPPALTAPDDLNLCRLCPWLDQADLITLTLTQDEMTVALCPEGAGCRPRDPLRLNAHSDGHWHSQTRPPERRLARLSGEYICTEATVLWHVRPLDEERIELIYEERWPDPFPPGPICPSPADPLPDATRCALREGVVLHRLAEASPESR